jgi:hypothetical protein
LTDDAPVPFLLAGGNPNWVPRVPVLLTPPPLPPMPRRKGRPSKDLTGLAILLPNGASCLMLRETANGRWECLVDDYLAKTPGQKMTRVFTGSFLRHLLKEQERNLHQPPENMP